MLVGADVADEVGLGTEVDADLLDVARRVKRVGGDD